MVNPEKIKSGTINPRQDLGDLSSLQNSMGVRQRAGKRAVIIPLMVKEIEDEIFDYEVIDGKRRLQSALSIQIPKVPIVLETEFESPIDLLVMSLLSNDFRKEFSWLEKAQSYKSLHDQGLTFKEIGEMVELSESRVARYVSTYNKWISFKLTSTSVLEMETTYEVVNKCPEEDVPELVEYIAKNEISMHDTRKILYNLNRFCSDQELLKDFDEVLYEELQKKYYPHRFNPSILSVYDDERKIRTAKMPLIERIIDIENYPTKDSATKYARERQGEVIKRITKDGWLVRVVPFTEREIKVKFHKAIGEK